MRRKPRPRGAARGPTESPRRHPLRAAFRAGRPAPGARQPLAGPREAWLDERDAQGAFDVSRLVAHAEWSALAPLVERLGRDPALVLPRLAQYVARVLAWNRSASNLVSHADEARLVSRHLRESLEPAEWIASAGAGSCLDLGSGAGFPAIPLALAGVGERWQLVESRRPKVLFMMKTVQEFELHYVAPIHGRLERLVLSAAADDEAGNVNSTLVSNQVDVFTSRATLRLAPTLELASAVVRRGGSAFLWKGSRRSEELESLPPHLKPWTLEGETVLGGSNVSVLKFVRGS